MPSTNQIAGGQDRSAFPRLVDEIGHDPARFLDWPLVGDNVDDSRKLLLTARIRGIDRIDVLRAYKAVERRLGYGPADGPREGVIRLLDQREERLEEIGERPDRIPFGPRRPPCMLDTESVLSDHEETATDRLSKRRRTATDGGIDS